MKGIPDWKNENIQNVVDVKDGIYDGETSLEVAESTDSKMVEIDNILECLVYRLVISLKVI